nr:zyxin [Loxodonta africana]
MCGLRPPILSLSVTPREGWQRVDMSRLRGVPSLGYLCGAWDGAGVIGLERLALSFWEAGRGPQSLKNVLGFQVRPPGAPGPLTLKEVEELEQLTQQLMQDMEQPQRSGAAPSELCGRCCQPLARAQPAVLALGQLFHIACFTCHQCARQLQGQQFYSMEAVCLEVLCLLAPHIDPAPSAPQADCGKPLSIEADDDGCFPLDGHVLCRKCHTARAQT